MVCTYNGLSPDYVDSHRTQNIVGLENLLQNHSSPFNSVTRALYADTLAGARTKRQWLADKARELENVQSRIQADMQALEATENALLSVMGPVHSLPDDILLCIFAECVFLAERKWAMDCAQDVHPFWTFPLVCRRWKTLMESTPALWTYLLFLATQAEIFPQQVTRDANGSRQVAYTSIVMRRTQRVLERSNGLPLCLDGNFHSLRMQFPNDLAFPVVRELWLRDTTAPPLHLRGVPPEHLQLMGPAVFPELRKLVWVGNQTPGHLPRPSFIECMPNLEDLELCRHHRWLPAQLFNWQKLKVLTLRECHLPQILTMLDNLEQLVVDRLVFGAAQVLQNLIDDELSQPASLTPYDDFDEQLEQALAGGAISIDKFAGLSQDAMFSLLLGGPDRPDNTVTTRVRAIISAFNQIGQQSRGVVASAAMSNSGLRPVLLALRASRLAGQAGEHRSGSGVLPPLLTVLDPATVQAPNSAIPATNPVTGAALLQPLIPPQVTAQGPATLQGLNAINYPINPATNAAASAPNGQTVPQLQVMSGPHMCILPLAEPARLPLLRELRIVECSSGCSLSAGLFMSIEVPALRELHLIVTSRQLYPPPASLTDTLEKLSLTVTVVSKNDMDFETMGRWTAFIQQCKHLDSLFLDIRHERFAAAVVSSLIAWPTKAFTPRLRSLRLDYRLLAHHIYIINQLVRSRTQSATTQYALLEDIQITNTRYKPLGAVEEVQELKDEIAGWLKFEGQHPAVRVVWVEGNFI